MKRFVFIVFLFVLNSTFVFPQHINRLNKAGNRTGKWVIYSDSAETKKLFSGKFKNGNTVGVAYYYTTAGKLDRKEIKRFGRLKTTFYDSSGTIRMKGKAKIENLPDKIHYYFYGRWKYYNPDGSLLKYGYFKKGELHHTKYADRNNKTNDSLVGCLNKIEKNFLGNNSVLLDSVRMWTFNAKKCEYYQKKLYASDTVTFRKIDFILKTYGYPDKIKTGESSDIPFFILSYAPAKVKEQYLELFKSAAEKGLLSWSTLAFYIDKIKVAKGEEQVYGTQFYYDKNRNIIYYPVLNPENLHTRRVSVGLDEP